MSNNLPSVLFVEDCDSDFELACAAVESVGTVATRRASNLLELVSFLKQGEEGVDLYVVDMSLPDGNGLDLAKLLRDNDATHCTPIVIFTSSTNPEHIQQAKRVGANDYRIKPVAPQEFLRVVGDIVQCWLPRTGPAAL